MPVLAGSNLKQSESTTYRAEMVIIGGNATDGSYSEAPVAHQDGLGAVLFKKTIDCLAKYESSGNPAVVNWNDNGSPSYGLLQFKQGTFKHFCVDKYGFPDEVMNPIYQTHCADYMLRDNYKNIHHWTPWAKCI